jgi:transposase-like protein/IS1 family transposase
MVCHNCQIEAKKHGKDRKGNQRYRCDACSKTFGEPQDKALDNMYLPLEKAVKCLELLCEGCSLRMVERVTGVSLHTLLKLLVLAGERSEQLLESRIKNMVVHDVEADEMWSFVGCKEKTKKRNGYDTDQLGDAYTFVAIERHTKLVLAWHLGRRSVVDTFAFTEKIYQATTGSFQMTTDGFKPYRDAVVHSLGGRYVDFAQLIKVYAPPREGEQRYSPGEVSEVVPVPIHGNPTRERMCTSHVERQNLTMRMQLRRLTRLTNGFSKKWENLKAALALYFAWYNFVRVHQTLRVTPAMESGLTDHVWSFAELLAA